MPLFPAPLVEAGDPGAGWLSGLARIGELTVSKLKGSVKDLAPVNHVQIDVEDAKHQPRTCVDVCGSIDTHTWEHAGMHAVDKL